MKKIICIAVLLLTVIAFSSCDFSEWHFIGNAPKIVKDRIKELNGAINEKDAAKLAGIFSEDYLNGLIGTKEKDSLTFDELCDACPWLKKAVDCEADLAKIVIKTDDVDVRGVEFEIAYVTVHIKDNDNTVNYEVLFFMKKTEEVWYINEAYLRDE